MNNREDAWLDIWPCAVAYDPKANAARCALRFLNARPYSLTSYGEQSLTSRKNPPEFWCGSGRIIGNNELAAEICATDPGHVNDVGKIMKMVRTIHLLRFQPPGGKDAGMMNKGL